MVIETRTPILDRPVAPKFLVVFSTFVTILRFQRTALQGFDLTELWALSQLHSTNTWKLEFQDSVRGTRNFEKMTHNQRPDFDQMHVQKIVYM